MSVLQYMRLFWTGLVILHLRLHRQHHRQQQQQSSSNNNIGVGLLRICLCTPASVGVSAWQEETIRARCFTVVSRVQGFVLHSNILSMKHFSTQQLWCVGRFAQAHGNPCL